VQFFTFTFVEFWHVLCQMAPYLLFGFLMAGVFSVLISPQTVERHFGGRGVRQVIKAAVFGVPLPLCSCSVIPVSVSLRKHGASRGATTAFLISTPQTGVDSILATYSLLGGIIAIFRPLAALISGIVGGTAVAILEPGASGDASPAPECRDACCEGKADQNRVYRALRYGFVTLPRDISKSLLVGLVIAGVISALVPNDYLGRVLGGGMGSMVVMMLVGIPTYVCATASVPIAAALIAKGVSPGAALVFLMTGPASNAATVATVWKTMGRRVAVIYLASIAVTALVSGVALDRIITVVAGPARHYHIHEAAPGLLGVVCAFALMGVMAFAILRPVPPAGQNVPATTDAGEQRVELDVTGMTCDHCAESVRRALLECSGVDSAEVCLKPGRALVRGDGFDVEALCNAVRGLGYNVEPQTGSAKKSSVRETFNDARPLPKGRSAQTHGAQHV
jgi:uncharacterized membrane protein YraQ (UPF0718 family)/copper chaperone CopZ